MFPYKLLVTVWSAKRNSLVSLKTINHIQPLAFGFFKIPLSSPFDKGACLTAGRE